MVEEVRRRRSTLAAELEESRLEAEQLELRLREIISADATREVNLDPVEAAELAAYATSFSGRKGSLPWPAAGVVRPLIRRRG